MKPRHFLTLAATMTVLSAAPAAAQAVITPPLPPGMDSSAVTLQGARARQSDYAAEAVSFVRTLHDGNPASIRARMGPNDPMRHLPDADLVTAVEVFRSLTPDPDTLAATIDRVVIGPNQVEVSAPFRGSRSTIHRPRDGAGTLAP